MSEVYPKELYPGCPCYACDSQTWERVPLGFARLRMSLCPTCGNKRCPGAADHRKPCSGSNEPGQPGSLYETVHPLPVTGPEEGMDNHR